MSQTTINPDAPLATRINAFTVAPEDQDLSHWGSRPARRAGCASALFAQSSSCDTAAAQVTAAMRARDFRLLG